MSSIVLKTIKRCTKMQTVLLIVSILFAIAYSYFSSCLTIEDAQQFLFPFFIIIVFFSSQLFRFKIPTLLLIISLIFWIGFLYRVKLMDKTGFFEGRIILGRFSDDYYGFEGRKLYKTLQKIAKTYHLPGPALLPISRDSKFDSNFNSNAKPALEIYGDKGTYDLIFPRVNYSGLIYCNGRSEVCPEDFSTEAKLMPYFKDNEIKIAIPEYPNRITIARKPGYVIEHFIEWMSAYFSSQINFTTSVREDVLYEAATLEGLPVQRQERIFAKIMISYEQVANFAHDKSLFYIKDSSRRLAEVLEIIKIKKDPELYALSTNLLAVDKILLSQRPQDLVEVEDLLLKLSLNEKVSKSQRAVAAYNIATIDQIRAILK